MFKGGVHGRRRFLASVRVHLRDGGRDTVSVAGDEGVSAAAVEEPISSVAAGDVLRAEG